MVKYTMSENQTTVIDKDVTYGFEGGKIVLAIPTVYHFEKGDMNVPHRIVIHGEKKQAVEIRSKNGYDALLRILQSRAGRDFREKLADTLSIDQLE